MAKRIVRSISAFLKRAETIIKNSLSDTTIQELVSKFGYTADRLNEGQQLLNVASGAVDTRTASKGAQKEETSAVSALRLTAEKAYESLAKIARGEFKNTKENLAKLGLNGEMPQTVAEFIESGKILFDNALADDEIKTALAKYNYDDAKLTSEKQKILDFESGYDEEAAAKGTAKQSTSDKNQAVKDLKKWVSQYVTVAKVALADNRVLLNKLGITVRTTKTKAQRNAPKKASATRAAMKSSPKKQG